jgi:hypothetical protein
MREAVAILGLGELGQWFAQGFLKQGVPVVPIVRAQDPAQVLAEWSAPEGPPLLVAVGESDLAAALHRIPEGARRRVALLQNATFDADVAPLGVTEPTWVVVWALRRTGHPQFVGQPTVAWGPLAERLVAAQRAVGMPAQVLQTEAERDLWMVSKYAFILTISALGLGWGGSIAEARAALSAEEAGQGGGLDGLVGACIALASTRAPSAVDRSAARGLIMQALDGMAGMTAAGRTARARIDDALRRWEQSRAEGVWTPESDAVGVWLQRLRTLG